MAQYLVVAIVIAFIFRKPLGKILARQFPDRAKRHRVVGTIILGFLLVMTARLVAQFW